MLFVHIHLKGLNSTLVVDSHSLFTIHSPAKVHTTIWRITTQSITLSNEAVGSRYVSLGGPENNRKNNTLSQVAGVESLVAIVLRPSCNLCGSI